MKRSNTGPHGVVVVDKHAGVTSHDIVNRARRIFETRRIGHTGTLDPLATGVLVLCLGNATRLVETLSGHSKIYQAVFRFGITTDSEDITGEVRSETDASGVTRERLEEVLCRFRGPILQVPPMVSALHHEGKRLYDLARQGVEVERQAREITIHRLDLLSFEPGERAQACVRVECSTGTYIRTLGADIGAALGVGGAMWSLRRERVGAFMLEHAYTLQALEQRKEDGTLAGVIHGLADAVPAWPRVTLDAAAREEVRHGRAIATPTEWAGEPGAPALLVDQAGEVLAIAKLEGGALAPHRVFITD